MNTINIKKTNTSNYNFVLLLVCFVASFFNCIYAEANPSLQQMTSLIKYVCLVFLYLRNFQLSFKNISSMIPLLFVVFIVFLHAASPFHYSSSKEIVLFSSILFLYIILNTSLVMWQCRLLSVVLFALLFYILFFPNPTRLINTNQAAFLYLIMFTNLLCTIKLSKPSKTIYFLSTLSAFVLCFAGIMICNSRTSLLVLLCVTFLPSRIMKLKRPLLVFAIICFIGIIIPFLYTDVSSDYSMRKTLETDMEELDYSDKKLFSGREIVWSEIIDLLKEEEHFFFGGIELFWWEKSNHNSYFDIIVEFGSIMLLIILVIYGHYIKNFFATIQKKWHSIIYSVFFLFIWGYTESGLFLGNIMLVMMPIAYIFKDVSKTGQLAVSTVINAKHIKSQ